MKTQKNFEIKKYISNIVDSSYVITNTDTTIF